MQTLVEQPGYSSLGIPTPSEVGIKSPVESLRSILTGKIICMEGPIAAGKTEFIKSCREFLQELGLKCEIFSEDVDEYLLERFNRDPAAYAALFQQRMMTSRLISADKARECKDKGESVILLDTGILREIAFASANMNENAYKSHMEAFSSAFEGIGSPMPDLILLFDCTAERTMINMMQRNRRNEALLTVDYMNIIRSHYAAALEHDLVKGRTKILTLDVSDQYAPLSILDSVVRILKK